MFYALGKNAQGKEMCSIVITCNECHKPIRLVVGIDDLNEWRGTNPRHVQAVFPYLSASEREMFITRICGDCWNRIFENNESED